MTTPAQVRSAWDSAIWQHATVQAITTQIFDFEPTQNSNFELGRLRYQTEINYFTYTVLYSETIQGMNVLEQRFDVEINYYRRADEAGDNYNAVIDNLYTIQTLVRSELGASWSSTIDYYQTPEESSAPELITVDSVTTWRAAMRYAGFKTISA